MNEMARLNVTWQGGNGDLPEAVPYDATDGDVKQMAMEAIRDGHIPGLRAGEANFTDYVVERFPVEAGVRAAPVIFLRAKTEYGESHETV